MPKAAIRGGTPIRTRPFASWPVFDGSERDAVLQVLESGSWGGYSPKVAEFETAFANYHGCQFGISCANGTVSLEAALTAAGIGPGAEVIVPPITFIATATAVLRAGGTPVFADIDPQTYNLDPRRVEEAITPRTRAVVPVHFAGQPADMDAIIDLGRRYDLVVIEDAAHAHGASWRNRPVGSLGDFGSFSFQQSKNMTAGEGGILITNDAALAERARSVCNQGRRTGGAWYEHPALGSNFRLTGWQSAVLLAQLGRLPRQLEQRRTAAALLDRALYDSGIVSPPAVDSRATTHGWYLYTMRVNVAALEGVSKDVFVRALTAEGIPGASSYPQPIYGNTVFSGRPHRRTECPQSERFARECFWVSHEVLMASSEALADFVRTIEKLRDCADELRELSAQTVS